MIKCTDNIFALALMSMFRKTIVFTCYLAIMFAPVIIYVCLIQPLEWRSEEPHGFPFGPWKPTDESIKRFKEISMWFVGLQSIIALISSLRLGTANYPTDNDDFCCVSPCELKTIFSPCYLICLSIIWELTSIVTLSVWHPDPVAVAIGCIPIYIYTVGVPLGCWFTYEYSEYSTRNKLKETSQPVNSDDTMIELDEKF